MAAKAKLSATQKNILLNIVDGRRYDHGRPIGMSASGGWDRAYRSCYRRGWLSVDDGSVTDAGRRALEGKE